MFGDLYPTDKPSGNSLFLLKTEGGKVQNSGHDWTILLTAPRLQNCLTFLFQPDQ